MTFVTVWRADWKRSERLPAALVQEWYDEGHIQVGLKPNRSGRKDRWAYYITEAALKVRDVSAQMSAWVTEAAVDGSWRHAEIVKTWAGGSYMEPFCRLGANYV